MLLPNLEVFKVRRPNHSKKQESMRDSLRKK